MKTLTEWCYQNNRQDILERWSAENEISPSQISFGSEKKMKWVCENNLNRYLNASYMNFMD